MRKLFEWILRKRLFIITDNQHHLLSREMILTSENVILRDRVHGLERDMEMIKEKYYRQQQRIDSINHVIIQNKKQTK